MSNVNLPIQCISCTVPLVTVVRFLPQERQAGFPRDGWYMPSGQREHVLFFVLYEPAGQSAEGSPDRAKKVSFESNLKFTSSLPELSSESYFIVLLERRQTKYKGNEIENGLRHNDLFLLKKTTGDNWNLYMKLISQITF